jgi:hypothetical protein
MRLFNSEPFPMRGCATRGASRSRSFGRSLPLNREIFQCLQAKSNSTPLVRFVAARFRSPGHVGGDGEPGGGLRAGRACCRAVMTEEAAARPDEEHRAMYRRLEPLLQGPPDPALAPINRTLNTNMNAFALERLEGLHTCGHHVGLNDLIPGLLRRDIDPELLATMDLLFDRQIEIIADRIRRGEPG